MTGALLGKIVSDRKLLFELRNRWERQGCKVVFTNGVFDILHRGHLDYLLAARSYGDILIVGVNSDSSVKRLKGQNRPLVDEGDRAFALACLRFVDLVTVFGEDTPLELISRLKPDVLVKGADYSEDQIVGADEVKAAGGRVVRIPLTEGRSSTLLIEKILNTHAEK